MRTTSTRAERAWPDPPLHTEDEDDAREWDALWILIRLRGAWRFEDRSTIAEFLTVPETAECPELSEYFCRLLDDLEAEGLIEPVWSVPGRGPRRESKAIPRSSLSRKNRLPRLYRLTDAGETHPRLVRVERGLEPPVTLPLFGKYGIRTSRFLLMTRLRSALLGSLPRRHEVMHRS